MHPKTALASYLCIMKTYLGLLLLLGQSALSAETLLVSQEAGDPAWTITLVGAYQIEDEIWMTTDLERSYEIAPCVVSYPYDSISVNLPSIVAKNKGDLEVISSPRPLVLHRNQITDFDFQAGDGWVDSDIVGWIYIRSYPWVWSSGLGWLYVVEGEIVSEIRFDRLSASYRAPSKLSFYFYSDKHGWLWKSPYSEKYYQYNTDTYRTLEEFNNG
jgi:hypothetical protein